MNPLRTAFSPTMRDQIAPGLFLIFCCAAVGVIVFTLLSYAVVQGATAEFDRVVRSEIHSLASPALTSAMRIFTTFGSRRFLLPLLLALGILFYLLRWTGGAWFLGISAAGAMGLDILLKELFYRPRPEPFFGIPAPASYSFPSGHALASFCFYGSLAVLLSRRLRNSAARAAVWIGAAALIALIGFSRIYLGVHYPSDVIAGYAVALVWVTAVAYADHAPRTRRARSNQRDG